MWIFHCLYCSFVWFWTWTQQLLVLHRFHVQLESVDQHVRNANLGSILLQRSTQFLNGRAIGISHNAFSHRETSSQHEQGRNAAWVWERPFGRREGVTDQRARQREGREAGVCTEGSRVSLGQTFFFFFIYKLRMKEAHGKMSVYMDSHNKFVVSHTDITEATVSTLTTAPPCSCVN